MIAKDVFFALAVGLGPVNIILAIVMDRYNCMFVKHPLKAAYGAMIARRIFVAQKITLVVQLACLAVYGYLVVIAA